MAAPTTTPKEPATAKEAFANGDFEKADQLYSAELGAENITPFQRRSVLSNRCLVRLKRHLPQTAYSDISLALTVLVPDGAQELGIAHGFLYTVSACGTPQPKLPPEEISPDEEGPLLDFTAALVLTRPPNENDDRTFFQKAFYRRGVCELRLGFPSRADVSFRISHALDPSVQLTIDCIAEARYMREQMRNGVYDYKKLLDYYLEPWDWMTTVTTRKPEKKSQTGAGGTAGASQQPATIPGGQAADHAAAAAARKVKDPLCLASYTHPAVEKRAVPGKGRGLVVAAPVAAGTLLLVERAFVLSRNEHILCATKKKLETVGDEEFQKFFALTDGSAEAEAKFEEDTERDLAKVLNHNAHSCQIVDT